MTTLDLDTLYLAEGCHDSPDDGMCLLEEGRAALRFRADGVPAKGTPASARLWGRVAVVGECWEFTGCHNSDGYGQLRVNGRTVKAHRLAYLLAFEDPGASHVCHRCDNPPCCNPAHLFLGTHADNNADRHAKGRTVMPTNGPDYWRAKTHCPKGHPYAGDNVRYRADGRRRCATCYRQRAAKRLAANRDHVNARRRANRAAQRSA